MYLKRLELQGFKSFAKKTVVKFEDGITAVVGPNGSGKSNISDAVRWVLGEQSAKSLRGEKMEDIIFSGAENTNPLGFAEVNLILNNEKNIFNTEYKEIVISRRVFRTGESEYYINGKSKRLKDIREVFMDTGIGKDGYSIIGQGKIDEILSSKSEDRRNIFEEAAGIVKYKTRKIESERKLKNTKDNLIRIEDIIAELEIQLDPLRVQAEKAEKYLELSENLKKYEVELLSIEMKKEKEKKSEAENGLKDIEERLNSIEQKEIELEEEIEEKEENIESIETEISKMNEFKYEYVNSREQYNRKIGVTEEKLLSNETEDKRLSNSIELLGSEIEELKKSILENEKSYSKKREELDKKNIFLNRKIEKREELSDSIDRYESEIEEIKSETINSLNKISEYRIKKTSYDSNLNNFNKRQIQIEKELKKIDSKNYSIFIERRDLEKKNEDLSKEILNKEKMRFSKEKELKKVQERAESYRLNMEELKLKYEKDKSNMNIIKEMQKDYEGYYKGVKNFLNSVKRDSIGQGVLGVVAELIRTDKKYEKAVEVALGGSIQNIVTEDTRYARDYINYLKKNRLGRITFLPLDNIKPRYLNNSEKNILNEKGIIGTASNIIEYDNRFDNIFNYLLGRVIIVDDIDNMIEISKKYNNSLKMVTLEGDIMNPGGSMTGGNFRGNSLSLLGRSRQIEELSISLREIKGEFKNKKKLYEDLIEEIEILNHEIEKIKTEFNQIDIQRNNLKNSLDNINSNIENVEIDKKAYKEELDIIENEKLVIDRDKKKIDDLIKESIELESGNKDRINELNNSLCELKKEYDEIDTIVQEYQISFASLKESVKNLDQIIDNSNDELKKKLKKIEMERETYQNIKTERIDLEYKLKELKKEFDLYDIQIKENDEAINNINKEKEKTNEELKKMQDELKAINRSNTDVQNLLNKKNLDIERINIKIDSIRSRLWEEYEMNIILAEKAEKTGLSISELKREVNSLKNDIKSIGNVNIDSIEELKSLEERYEFMNDQRNDLVKAEKSLNHIIREMNNKMKEQFIERFEEIRIEFKDIFKELFGGGKADIYIEDTEDILNSGIEIVAEPPGKKLQSLSLLSGGERALTAISILFAIIRTKPTPFCILDEIEAALDEANVYRYADYLKKFSEKSQFIVITHRKGTMESANSIYGVTMQRDGISNMISMKLDQYEEII
ncbi:MAG: chromosome segregation protein SMC [Andreesenia angusta]|nr:chromosome segregation protein SMC [Andreesenia angusta]